MMQPEKTKVQMSDVWFEEKEPLVHSSPSDLTSEEEMHARAIALVARRRKELSRALASSEEGAFDHLPFVDRLLEPTKTGLSPDEACSERFARLGVGTVEVTWNKSGGVWSNIKAIVAFVKQNCGCHLGSEAPPTSVINDE